MESRRLIALSEMTVALIESKKKFIKGIAYRFDVLLLMYDDEESK